MGLRNVPRIRWFCVSFLVAALAMVIVGLTALAGRMAGLFFLVYWLICFLFTGLAMLLALLDARTVALETREEHRSLLESTIKDIEIDAKAKRREGRAKSGQFGRN